MWRSAGRKNFLVPLCRVADKWHVLANCSKCLCILTTTVEVRHRLPQSRYDRLMCSRDDADLQFDSACLHAGRSSTARSKPLVLVVAAAGYHMHAHRPRPHDHEPAQVLSLGTRAGSLVSSGSSLSVTSRCHENNNLRWTPALCTNLTKQELFNQSHFHPSFITLVRNRSHTSYYASEAVADTLDSK